MPQTDSDREGIVIALLLDGKGSAVQVGWDEVEHWTPEHGALWLQLDRTSSRTLAWLTSQGDSLLAALGVDAHRATGGKMAGDLNEAVGVPPPTR